jgi:hypothetical protein
MPTQTKARTHASSGYKDDEKADAHHRTACHVDKGTNDPPIPGMVEAMNEFLIYEDKRSASRAGYQAKSQRKWRLKPPFDKPKTGPEDEAHNDPKAAQDGATIFTR